VDVEADSPFEAARRAHQRLRRAFDVLVFYRMGAAVGLHPRVLVSINGSWQWFAVEGSPHDVFRNRRSARHLTQRVISQIGLDQLDDRVANALELFAVAQKAGDHRSRLIGVWSALESLTGPSRGTDILTRVSRAVLPSVILRRLERIARYLAISLHRLRATRQFTADEAALFPASSNSSFSAEETLLALCGQEGNDRIMALLRVSAPQPLVLNRLFRTWQEFHEPETVHSRLKSSWRRVEWQLMRIYRARNLVVHQGRGYRNLELLLRHAEQYFTTTLTRILHDLVEAPQASLEQVLAGTHVEHDVLLHLLSTRPTSVRVRDYIRSARVHADTALYTPP